MQKDPDARNLAFDEERRSPPAEDAVDRIKVLLLPRDPTKTRHHARSRADGRRGAALSADCPDVHRFGFGGEGRRDPRCLPRGGRHQGVVALIRERAVQPPVRICVHVSSGARNRGPVGVFTPRRHVPSCRGEEVDVVIDRRSESTSCYRGARRSVCNTTDSAVRSTTSLGALSSLPRRVAANKNRLGHDLCAPICTPSRGKLHSTEARRPEGQIGRGIAPRDRPTIFRDFRPPNRADHHTFPDFRSVTFRTHRHLRSPLPGRGAEVPGPRPPMHPISGRRPYRVEASFTPYMSRLPSARLGVAVLAELDPAGAECHSLPVGCSVLNRAARLNGPGVSSGPLGVL